MDGRMYLGFVVEKRGRDERPGRHEPILTEAEYRRTIAAIASRTRVGNKPRPFRSYVLRWLLFCSCGTRMRGEAHLQRGTERRYYRCPTLGCRARRSPADLVEEAVLATIAETVLPGSVIDAARAELRRRLATPEVAVAGRQRARLHTRLEQLKKQHGWGDSATPNTRPNGTRSGQRSRRCTTRTGSAHSMPTGPASWRCPRRSPRPRGRAARSSVGSWSSWSLCGTGSWRPSTGRRRHGPSSKNSGSAPKGIRTPDLHLERVAS